MGIDATILLDDKARFRRCEFVDVAGDAACLSSDPDLLNRYVGR